MTHRISKFKELFVEDDERLFFVSDIHGELQKLKSVLAKVGFSSNDVLVLLGDVVDRGPQSEATLVYVLSKPNFHLLLGNHDYMFARGDLLSCLQNGGAWVLSLPDKIREELSSKLLTKPFAIEITKDGYTIGATHAAVPPEFEKWEDMVASLMADTGVEQDLMWERGFIEYSSSPFYNKPLYGVDFSIHGHTVVERPTFISNRLHIDTGACWDKEPYGKLTLVEFKHGKFEFII